MKKRDEVIFNNPLPYIFVVFILSSLCYGIYSKNKLLAIFIAGSFFMLLFAFKGLYITIVLMLFLVLGVVNNIWFYEYTPKNIEEIRIINVKSYYGRGKINGRIVNLTNINKEIKVGDRIVAKGEFIENKNTTWGYIGDYKINDYKLVKSDLICKLYRKREDVFNKIEEKLGNRKAALITSAAFGYKDELDEDDRELMGNLGILHAISVSGLHLVLVYSLLVKVLGAKLGLLMAFIYVLFTGATQSSLRAYIMIFIMSFGRVVHRNYNPLAALSLAGIIILNLRPYELFNVGFMLSFLATLGIILFNKDINKKLYRLPNKIRGTIAVSLSAQVFTLPLLIVCFNQVSLSFILGNVLVVPFITLLVVMGNILLLIENISFLFNYCLYLCHYIIRIIDILINSIDKLGISLLYLNHTAAYFYISLLTTYYFYKKGFKRFIYYPLIMSIYIGVLIYSPLPTIRYYKDGGLIISHKGDRVLIQTKEVVDKEKLKRISLTEKINEEINNISIGKEIKLKKQGENYILYTKDNKYLLLVNYEKINTECDIIDFRKGDIEEVKLFNNEVITRQ